MRIFTCSRATLDLVADIPAINNKRFFPLLRQLGLDDEQAVYFRSGVQTMVAANFIAGFESKLDLLVAE